MCRFYFPLPTLCNTQIIIPLLNHTKNLHLKAQSIFNKLNEMDMGQDVSLDDFLNALQIDEETYILALKSIL